MTAVGQRELFVSTLRYRVDGALCTLSLAQGQWIVDNKITGYHCLEKDDNFQKYEFLESEVAGTD